MLVTVIRHTAGAGVDEQGNPVESTSEIVSDGWWFAPGAPVEQADRVDVSGTLYGPHGADVSATDLIQFDGVTYSVIGEPEQWGRDGFNTLTVAGCCVLVKRRG